MTKVKIKPRTISRKKDHKKEMIRYELKRKSKKLIKKQISSLFSGEEMDNAQAIERNLDEKKNSLSLLYKTLDSHQSKGLITKGRANRLKSKCAKKLNSQLANNTSSTINKT